MRSWLWVRDLRVASFHFAESVFLLVATAVLMLFLCFLTLSSSALLGHREEVWVELGSASTYAPVWAYFLVMSFPQHWSGTVLLAFPPVPQLQALET